MTYDPTLEYDPDDIFGHFFDETVEQYSEPHKAVVPYWMSAPDGYDQTIGYAELANSLLAGYEVAHKAVFAEDYRIAFC